MTSSEAERLIMQGEGLITRAREDDDHFAIFTSAAMGDGINSKSIKSKKFDLWFLTEKVESIFQEDAKTIKSSAGDSRREANLLRIIASMRGLLSDKDGGNFPSQAKIIDQLVDRYGSVDGRSVDGISKRNLEKVFAEAGKIAGFGPNEFKPHRK